MITENERTHNAEEHLKKNGWKGHFTNWDDVINTDWEIYDGTNT